MEGGIQRKQKDPAGMGNLGELSIKATPMVGSSTRRRRYAVKLQFDNYVVHADPFWMS